MIYNFKLLIFILNYFMFIINYLIILFFLIFNFNFCFSKNIQFNKVFIYYNYSKIFHNILYKKINYEFIKFNNKNIINFLWKMNFFYKIKYFKLNNNLFIYLYNKLIINNIILNNNNKIYFSKKFLFKILSSFNINKNCYLYKNNLFKFKKFMLLKYKNIGLNNLKINFNIIKFNKIYILLKLNINNDLLNNLNINIYGNKFLNKDKFLLLLKDCKFDIVFLNKNKFNICLNKIKNFYFNYGFLDFSIIKIDKKIDCNNKLNINLYIHEGNRYRINNLFILSNISKLNKNILYNFKLNNLLLNNYFNYIEFKSFINKINFFLKKRGYIYIILNIKYKKILDNKIIFFMYIKLNNIYKIKNIILKSNIKKKYNFILYNLNKTKDYIYNKYILNKLIYNLLQKNYFKNIKFKLKIIDILNNNNLNIIYNLKFIKKGLLNFNINFGKLKYLNYKFIFNKKNLFNIGDDFNLNFTNNNYMNYSSFTFIKNLFKNINFKYKFYYNSKIYNLLFNNRYSNNYYGLNTGFFLNLNNNINYNLYIKYISNKIFNFNKNILFLNYLNFIFNNFLKFKNNNIYKYSNFFIKNILEINKLNDKYNPNNGFYLNLNTKISLPLLSNDKFYKFYFLFKKYISLNKKKSLILLTNIFFGFSNTFNNKNIPIYENFSNINNNFLRGFDYKDLFNNLIFMNLNFSNCKNLNNYCLAESYLGKNYIFYLSNEFIINNIFLKKKSSYNKYIKSILFIDSGFVLNNKLRNNHFKLSYINFNKVFKISYGLHTKIFTPLGYLNIILGFPLKNLNNKSNILNFYLSNN